LDARVFNATIAAASNCHPQSPEEIRLHNEAAGSAPPDAFGPFRVLHQIGAGALGQVFRAYDPEQDKLVAVKLFKLDLTPERVHQFVAELERLIAADLTHTSIAAPVAAGIVQASAYLAQDFVAADSLDTVVREHGPAPTAEGLRIVTQLAGALDYAAVVGVLHGALHPRDVLISPDDVRLTGLGIAKALELVSAQVPVRRPYAAAERAAGGPWDRRADVFSLAALAHEILWGRRITATGNEAAAALTPLTGARLDALRELFAAALADEPAKRFPTALEFAKGLKSCFEQPSVVAPLLPLEEVRKPAEEIEIVPSGASPVGRVVPELSVPPVARVSEAAPDLELRRPEAPAAELPVAEPVKTVAAKTPEPVVEREPVPEPVSQSAERLIAPLPTPADLKVRPADLPTTPADLKVRPTDLPPADIPMREEEPALNLRPVKPEATAHAEPALRPAHPAMFGPMSSTPVEVARSAVWPLVLALVLGVALGFAGGYWMGEQRAAGGSVASNAAPPASETEVQLKPDSTSGARTGAAPALDASAPTNVAPPPAVPPAVEPTGAAPPAAVEPKPAPAPAAAPKPAPVARAGRITVRTTPAGARVLIDGKDVGKTPLTIPNLTNGAHTVRVIRDGFTTIDRRVSLTTSQPTSTLTLTMARSTAVPPARGARAATPPSTSGNPPTSLVVESRPTGATVFIDGKRVGLTPLAIPGVAAGSHAVRLEMAGYKPWTSSVQVVTGERNRVAASLEQ
jgi:serine/threonine protein kinase